MGIGSPWYPDVEPGDLRRAARAYADLASAVDAAVETAHPAMARLFTANDSDTLAPYREAWEALSSSAVCGGGYLGELAGGCRRMSAGLEEAAAGIEALRDKIDTMVGAGAVVTVAAGILTFGLGGAAASAATGGAVATTVSVAISTFLTRVAIIAAFEFVGGYLTSLSLQALRQTIFEPGRPIDFDHGDAVTLGGISAATGGTFSGLGGFMQLRRNIGLLSMPAANGGRFSAAQTRGALAEFGAARLFSRLGESPITHRALRAPAGGRHSTAVVDILLDTPAAETRALLTAAGVKNANWRYALIEVKAGYPGRATADILSPGQQTVIVPIAQNGAQMSGRLQKLLLHPTGVIAPGEATPLVLRMSNDEFTRLPLTLRVALEKHGMEAVLNGAAGQRNAVRFEQWLESLRYLSEVP